jgi:hypothetical protein
VDLPANEIAKRCLQEKQYGRPGEGTAIFCLRFEAVYFWIAAGTGVLAAASWPSLPL